MMVGGAEGDCALVAAPRLKGCSSRAQRKPRIRGSSHLDMGPERLFFPAASSYPQSLSVSDLVSGHVRCCSGAVRCCPILSHLLPVILSIWSTGLQVLPKHLGLQGREDAEALSILHIDHSSLAGMDFGCVAGACEMLLSSNLASFS